MKQITLLILSLILLLQLSAIIDEFPWLEDFSEADISTNWPLEEWDRAEGELTENTQLVWDAFGWSPDDFANLTFPENISARINIYGTGRIHWLVTPVIQIDEESEYILSFDYALTQYANNNPGSLGEDDRFCVVVSPDSGSTWSDSNMILEFTSDDAIFNTSQNIEISLDGYTGFIRIGFYGESLISNEDVDFFVDNVQIFIDEFIAESPQNLTYEQTGNTITLNWEPPENSIPDAYRIYWDNELFATTSFEETSFMIEDFPNTEATFYATALYGEIESEQSNTITIDNTSLESVIVSTEINLTIYPNPISSNQKSRNPKANIDFNLEKDSHVKITVYNIKGQQISTIIDKQMSKGSHLIEWNRSNFYSNTTTAGIYLFKFEAGDNVFVKKLLMMK